MRSTSEPRFERVNAGPLGQRLCIFHAPAGAPLRGLVLHVHAFAEEMNKSRRMAALQSRALAASGYAVLQFDMLGCGDSDGEFADATWSSWLDDVLWALAHLRRRGAELVGASHGALPAWLWGHRLGCLLAVQAAQRLGPEPSCNLLLWQPVLSGRSALQQFLRLKTAGALLQGGPKTNTEDLRQRLLAGDAVEVAGYTISPQLAQGMDDAWLAAPAVPAAACWIETGPSAPPATSPAAARAAQEWRGLGWQVDLQAVQGPQFWQTTEIEDAPSLVACTCAALQRMATPQDDTAASTASEAATWP